MCTRTMLVLDHLAVVAPTLADGVAYVRGCLGLAMPEGGRHREIGTRNHLLRLGDALFLEVIAVDPEAPPPGRPRWFGLDDAAAVRADWAAGRRLRGFVARTDALDAALAAHPDLLGEAVTVTRGARAWRFGVRPDGAWAADGAAPCAMDWGPAGNPAREMPDLVALTAAHPDPAALEALYRTISLADPPRIVAGPALRFRAVIDTPTGHRVLT